MGLLGIFRLWSRNRNQGRIVLGMYKIEETTDTVRTSVAVEHFTCEEAMIKVTEVMTS